MHCVCKGILKRQLFKPWFNPQYATESNSLLGISHELDNMFPSIKVPHDFTRKPCGVAESIRISFVCPLCWTAMSSICCTFCTITLHYTALHFLLSVPISKPCVDEVQVLLDNFVKLLSSLYGIEECTCSTPMLNSTSLSNSSWPWFLCTYFCFCI